MVVHFVCRGNVLRSFIAETYLKSLELPNVLVISSGTVADRTRDDNKEYFESTKRLLEANGLGKYTKSQPEQLTVERLEGNDLVILMNDVVLGEAKEIGTLPENSVVWSITDIGEGARIPGIDGRGALEIVVYNEIIAKVDELAKSLKGTA